MQVLVIDDEYALRQVVAQTLEVAGHEVTVAADSRTALRILRHGRIQLVVSDSMMPGLSGSDLCRIIRNSDFGRYIYFIMLTGLSGPESKLDGLEAGADDYVTKPFQARELVLRVNTGCRIIRNESLDLTIFALAKLAEFRDPETGAHLDRVRRYSRALARQLQGNSHLSETVDAEFVRMIYETSPLHDIGKVAIPDAILRKRGPLTDQEFSIIKTHPTQAAQLLAAAMKEFPNTAFLKMAHDIAFTHHERYDGSGYPRGLSGEQIPLCGRIVALADVYDALTSRRVYKEAMSHDHAKALIVNEAGKHFDPLIVRTFCEIEEKFIKIAGTTNTADYLFHRSGNGSTVLHHSMTN